MFEDIVDRKIRIAIIGCGRIAANHFASIAQYPDDFELVAVCDNSRKVLAAAEKAHKVPGFTSLDQMLEQVDLDVVSICTPSGQHSEQAMKIASAGKTCHQ